MKSQKAKEFIDELMEHIRISMFDEHDQQLAKVEIGDHAKARGENDEKHICPLQLDTIRRAIHLWSNEGDTVLTPFLGIGPEVYEAIRLKRYGIGFELKDSYFSEAVKNCKAMEFESAQRLLFN